MRKNWRSKAAAVAMVAVGAVSMSACYQGNQDGPKVAVLGDSITALATTDIQQTLGPNYADNVVGQSGYTIDQSAPELQSMLADLQGTPTDAIVNLGTNDAIREVDWHTPLTAEALALANVHCVILVNISTYADLNQPAGDAPGAEQINTALAQLVSQHPNFHLLDYNAWVHSGDNYAEYIYPNALGLGIHETPAGAQAIANLYLAALQQDCH